MSTTTQIRVTFRDMINDLTLEHEHREPYTAELASGTSWTAHHSSRVPALVHQLLGATPSGGGGEQMGTTYKSRPAVRIEALDTAILIDTEAGEWLDRLGGTIPADSIDPETLLTIRGSGTVRTLRMLGGLHPSINHCKKQTGTKVEDGAWCCTRHELEHDVRHWWHQARIITGWDVPAFKPHNSCPVCEARDSLRIRIDAALCVECRSIWEGPDQIGVLARHIHEENEDDS